MSFAFLLEILIVAPIQAEKVTQWFGGDSRRTIPFSPTIGILAYLNGYAVIPLVAYLIEKRNGTVNRDGFHGNRRRNFYSYRNGSTRFSQTWYFLQRSHFWTWCRIFGRLLIPALGRVFNANLTAYPEHAILYAEVINITFNVNSKKLLRTFPLYVSRHFLTKKTIPRSLAFHQILLKNLFSHCLFDRLLAGSSDFSPFNNQQHVFLFYLFSKHSKL